MAELSDQVKTFIVQALACFEGPSRVAEMVMEEFGVPTTRMQVANYDPASYHGHKMAKRWKTLFNDTREAFRKEIAQRPIAQRAWRLAQLERIAIRNKSPQVVMQALEQAAKETGDWYQNKRLIEHSGKVEGTMAPVVNLTLTKPADG